MAVTTEIPWGDGSGDKIYLTRNASEGDQVVSVSSDANTGAARSKVVEFTSGVGSIVRQLTINQAAGGYVQDGLVMHFDGIDKGTDSNRWTSLVGSIYVTLNTHTTKNADSVSFDGAAGLTVNGAPSTNFSAGTIEVVAENLSSGTAAIYYGRSNKLSFIIAGAGYTFGVGSSNNQWNITKVAKFIASANSDRFMLNGTPGGTKASNSWSDKSSTTMGATPSGTRYWFTGKVYSIRIYNRKLTESEMLNNQKIDNERFNLGLNIL